MYRFCSKNKGAVSVFLTLILLPVFLFGGVIIDGTRILGAKNIVSGAGEMSMNAALANYDTALKDAYGLIAMSGSDEELNDNLQKYFEETINANGLTKEDVSRSFIYLELMNSSDFSAKPVADTQIYQTDIMKQQVVEYMKYRAPAILVKRGILDNIKQFEDVEAQKNSVQKQMEFENKLDKMQTDFDKINELIEKHKQSYRNISLSDFNGRLQQIKDTYNNRISLLCVAAVSLEDVREAESGDSYQQMERFLSVADNKIDSWEESYAAKTFEDLYKMKKISNGIKNPEQILDKIDSESDEYAEREEMIDRYKAELSNIESVSDEIRPIVQLLSAEANDELRLMYGLVCSEVDNCEEILTLTQKIRMSLKDLKDDYKAWGDSIQEVKSTEVKGNLEESHKEYEGLFGDQKDEVFEEKIANNSEYYLQLKKQLEEFTFCSKKLVEIDATSSFYSKASSYAKATDKESLVQQKNIFMNEEWGKEPGGGLKYKANVTLERKSLDGDTFVEKVREFSDKQEGDKQQSSSDSKKMDHDLKEELESYVHLLLSDDIPNLNMDAHYPNLPTDWIAAGTEAYQQASGLTVPSSINSKSGRNEIKGMTNDVMDRDNSAIHDLSNLFSQVEHAAVEGATNVYITEYIMDLFSYYTVNQSEDSDKEIDAPISISGYNFSESAMYRAEVEYILWGDPDLRDNVTNTKAMIFTVQMIGNTVFAFTNSQLKAEANAIAAVFPVGPLSKAAIRAAVLAVCSLVETTQDLKQMMDGDAIPLYKKADARGSTWETWPSALLLGLEKKSRKAGPQDMALTYRDYLWLFVCMNTLSTTKERNMLARAANCIEVNSEQTIKNSYTMIQIKADVNIDTFFLKKMGNETYHIPYYGIQGY